MNHSSSDPLGTQPNFPIFPPFFQFRFTASGQHRNLLCFKASKLDSDTPNGSCPREAPKPEFLNPLPGQVVPVLEGHTKQKTKCVTQSQDI